jgi:hypothetical protein
VASVLPEGWFDGWRLGDYARALGVYNRSVPDTIRLRLVRPGAHPTHVRDPVWTLRPNTCPACAEAFAALRDLSPFDDARNQP